MSAARLIVVGLVTILASSALALLLDGGEGRRTATDTITQISTSTITVTETVPRAGAAQLASPPAAAPQPPPAPSDGFDIAWHGPLRLNQSGHDLYGVDGPEPDEGLPNIVLTLRGDIVLSRVNAAEWTSSKEPSAADCKARVNTQGMSSSEASSIQPRSGLGLCLGLSTADGTPRVGFLRVRAGFTDLAALVDGVLWDEK